MRQIKNDGIVTFSLPCENGELFYASKSTLITFLIVICSEKLGALLALEQ